MSAKNLTFMEVKILQIAVKKFVKIGELETAAKIFDKIKTYFRKE